MSASEALNDLTSITGLSVPEATILLEASGGDLSTAVSLHFQSFDEDSHHGRPDSSGQAFAGGETESEPGEEYGHDEGDHNGDDEPARSPVADRPVITRFSWALSVLVGSLPGWSFTPEQGPRSLILDP